MDKLTISTMAIVVVSSTACNQVNKNEEDHLKPDLDASWQINPSQKAQAASSIYRTITPCELFRRKDGEPVVGDVSAMWNVVREPRTADEELVVATLLRVERAQESTWVAVEAGVYMNYAYTSGALMENTVAGERVFFFERASSWRDDIQGYRGEDEGVFKVRDNMAVMPWGTLELDPSDDSLAGQEARLRSLTAELATYSDEACPVSWGSKSPNPRDRHTIE